MSELMSSRLPPCLLFWFSFVFDVWTLYDTATLQACGSADMSALLLSGIGHRLLVRCVSFRQLGICRHRVRFEWVASVVSLNSDWSIIKAAVVADPQCQFKALVDEVH